MQRYRFFFSKQHENGVERCWLQFGYFQTMEEAQKWRDVLYRVYPTAAIRTVPQGEGARSTTTSNTLSDTQVLALLNKGAGADSAPAEPPARSRPERQKTTLEDTLNELRDSAWRTFDLDTDEVSSTGVRHLRVEVQAKPRPPAAKLHKAKKKS